PSLVPALLRDAGRPADASLNIAHHGRISASQRAWKLRLESPRGRDPIVDRIKPSCLFLSSRVSKSFAPGCSATNLAMPERPRCRALDGSLVRESQSHYIATQCTDQFR